MPKVIRRWIEEEMGGGRCVDNQRRCQSAALYLAWWQFGPKTGCAKAVCQEHADAYAKKWRLTVPWSSRLQRMGEGLTSASLNGADTMIASDVARDLGRGIAWTVKAHDEAHARARRLQLVAVRLERVARQAIEEIAALACACSDTRRGHRRGCRATVEERRWLRKVSAAKRISRI